MTKFINNIHGLMDSFYAMALTFKSFLVNEVANVMEFLFNKLQPFLLTCMLNLTVDLIVDFIFSRVTHLA